MTREEIVAALEALAAELHELGIDGEMYVVGGAAIAIAFDARRPTRDIDAVFEPKTAIYAAAERVGSRRGLPAGWLNDGVKGFLAGPDPHAAPVLERPGLRVLVASPRMQANLCAQQGDSGSPVTRADVSWAAGILTHGNFLGSCSPYLALYEPIQTGLNLMEAIPYGGG